MPLSLLKQDQFLFHFNYFPLLIRYPVKPIHNLIDLLIRHRDLALNLFAFGGGRKGGFLFMEVEHPVHEGDELVVDGFF